MEGVRWEIASALDIVRDASAEFQIQQTASNELRPLDLSGEPGLAGLLEAIDLDDFDEDGGPLAEHPAASPAAPVPSWRPRPGWGTIRGYSAAANRDGSTDVTCVFVPDDGSEAVTLTVSSARTPELGDYARGVMTGDGELTIKVSADTMLDAEQHTFARINALEPAERAQIYAEHNDLVEDCGWAWTTGYTLAKAAPGLTG